MGQVFTVRRLRWGLVIGAVALLAVIAGFAGYGRYVAHKFWKGLPGRLGAQITQETDNVTYSQSWQGRTVFTVHAAKQFTHKDGMYTLRDVGIVLYGRKGERTDQIHGNEFEYDSRNGLMTARGEVFIDLAPPARNAARKTVAPEQADSRIIHLKTSGLVFRQKERSASTDEELSFVSGGLIGRAVGASYDSAEGVVVLRSAVRISGLRHERPMLLTAASGELDRNGNTAIFERATLVSTGVSGTQTVAAEHAVIHTSSDGTPERLDARGQVILTGTGRGRLTANALEMEFNEASEPKSAHLAGQVRFLNEDPQRRQHGQADDVRIAFDADGRPTHAVLAGGVNLQEGAGRASRSLVADKVDLSLSGGGKEKLLLRGADAVAVNGVRLHLLDAAAGKGANGLAATEVTADTLKASFAAGSRLTALDGTGRTHLERTQTDAVSALLWKETSFGNTLHLDFAAGPRGRAVLSRLEQRGAVKLVREAAAKSRAASAAAPAGPEVEHAEADEAIYDANADRMTMSGAVKLSDISSSIFADRVQMDRASGDATADGSVRVSYEAPSSGATTSTSEPLHVLAAHAVAHKASGVTQYTGSSGAMAKMWQAGSQVEAPLLEFDRTKRMLTARDPRGGDVRCVLVDNEPKKGKAGAGGTIRVTSREMTYTDLTRLVEFSGRVRVDDRDGVLRAQEGKVFLAKRAAASTGASGTSPLALGGRIDHLLMQGSVELEQPGRRATGDRLVYSADDQTFILTGTKAAPPRLVDDANGTVTGASLRFRTGDDSVEVSGGDGASRVRSETRMKPKE